MIVLSATSVRLFATLWTVACQASLSIGFSWQEYWSGLPFPSPGGLSHPGIELASPVSCIGRQVLYHKDYLSAYLGDKKEIEAKFCD